MKLRLTIVLILIMLLLLMYIFKNIKNNKIEIRHFLIWILADIFAILSIVFVDPLLKFANFVGIETVSNLMFFLSIIFLLILCFNLSSKLSEQNKKIIKLTQELGILKNEIEVTKK